MVVFAYQPKTQKQTQRGRQNGKTKKQASNEITGEFSRRKAKLNGGKQLIMFSAQSDDYKHT